MIKRQEVAVPTSGYLSPHVHLVHLQGGLEIERIDLGRDCATSRQQRNLTEVYVVGGTTLRLTGTGRKHYLRRITRPPYQIIASTKTRDELYPYLFLFVKHLNGKSPRRNLFKEIHKLTDPTDPVEILMKNIGY
jgi:hypothetical protein